jgi:hypothetical protein
MKVFVICCLDFSLSCRRFQQNCASRMNVTHRTRTIDAIYPNIEIKKEQVQQTVPNE